MKMELKDALELAIFACEHLSNNPGRIPCDEADNLYEAARLLREGSKKTEHSEIQSVWTCPRCRRFGGDCSCSPTVHHIHWVLVDYTKTYTTHNELKIIEVTSDPTFVEIGDTE